MRHHPFLHSNGNSGGSLRQKHVLGGNCWRDHISISTSGLLSLSQRFPPSNFKHDALFNNQSINIYCTRTDLPPNLTFAVWPLRLWQFWVAHTRLGVGNFFLSAIYIGSAIYYDRKRVQYFSFLLPQTKYLLLGISELLWRLLFPYPSESWNDIHILFHEIQIFPKLYHISGG